LTELVMQIAGERSAFGLLNLEVLLSETAIFAHRRGQMRLGATAVNNLAPSLEVAPQREPDQADRQHQQHTGEFIEL